ncbi:unnamed protein product [Leptosia nina]|uniref:Uncharacterized protein n=1 Tax=Leptosia nina TaxID=320188 RepID=A0AAV1J3G6_9NEOP
MKLEVFYVIEEVTSITVKPCPTNKIAPHRRSARHNNPQSRTFGHFYSLFADGDQGNSGLQEEPQADDPEDCGDIEDYDENDLSSVTRDSQRKQGEKTLFNGPFGFFFGRPPSTNKPTTTRRPEPYRQPTRPPPGGYFSGNPYRPQLQLNPSDNLKPVQEYDHHEPQMMYRPGLVGVPLGHVVGMHQIKPTRHPSHSKVLKIHPQSVEPIKQVHKHLKTRNVESGVFRSFFDLLF